MIEKPLGLERLLLRRFRNSADCEVDATFQKGIALLFERIYQQHNNSDARMRPAHALDRRRHNADGRGFVAAYQKLAGGGIGQVLDFRNAKPELVENGVAGGEHVPPLRCGIDALRTAVEQPRVQQRFEISDCLRQHGLRNAERAGGFRQASLLRDNHQAMQVPQFEAQGDAVVAIHGRRLSITCRQYHYLPNHVFHLGWPEGHNIRSALKSTARRKGREVHHDGQDH